MIALSALLVVLVALALPCGGTQQASARPIPEQDVMEVVFRFLFIHNLSGLKGSPTVYCLELPGGKDPGPQFIRRFSDIAVSVKPGSDCECVSEPEDFLCREEQRGTGLPGLRFYIREIKWKSKTEAVAIGGHFATSLNASSVEYHVLIKDGDWVVAESKVLEVS